MFSSSVNLVLNPFTGVSADCCCSQSTVNKQACGQKGISGYLLSPGADFLPFKMAEVTLRLLRGFSFFIALTQKCCKCFASIPRKFDVPNRCCVHNCKPLL